MSNNWAQQKNEITINEYSSFLKEASTKYLNIVNERYQTKESISQNEINEIKRNLFLSYRLGLPELTRMFAQERNEILENANEKYEEHFNYSKKQIENELMMILKNRIPSLEYKMIDNYLIVKGRVLNKSEGFDSFDETNFKLHFNYFVIEVEEIIVGDITIKAKDVINIYYASEWCENGVMYYPDSIIADSFLFRLRDNGLSNNSKYKYALYSNCFPISNEYVYDSHDYFENGEKIEWNKLKLILNKTINDIIGGNNEN